VKSNNLASVCNEAMMLLTRELRPNPYPPSAIIPLTTNHHTTTTTTTTSVSFLKAILLYS
jgi:hypothetical protein